MEGTDLSSVMLSTWRGIAASESRIYLMSELIRMNIGFAEIEQFAQDLSSQYRSQDFREKVESGEMTNPHIIKLAMEMKFRDEKILNEELNKERNILRKKLEDSCKKNSKTYRAKIKELRKEALMTKNDTMKKFEAKLEHLRGKYRKKEDEKITRIPKGLENYWDLSVFDMDKFDSVKFRIGNTRVTILSRT